MPIQVSAKCCCHSWCQIDASPGVSVLMPVLVSVMMPVCPGVRVLMPVLVSEGVDASMSWCQSVDASPGVRMLMSVLVSEC